MALNLMTPQYVAPDVTKAPLAGEALSSSRSRTNLARRAQSAREMQDAEDNAVRRAELGLKSEAQRVNLAGQQQAMRHKEELLPFHQRALNASLVSQQLRNEYDASSMEDRLLAQELDNEGAEENIANARLNRQLTREQMEDRQIAADKQRKSTAALTRDQDRAREMYEAEDWQSLEEFVPSTGMLKDDRDALQANIDSMLKDQEAKHAIKALADFNSEFGKLSAEEKGMFSEPAFELMDNGAPTHKGNAVMARLTRTKELRGKMSTEEWLEFKAAGTKGPWGEDMDNLSNGQKMGDVFVLNEDGIARASKLVEAKAAAELAKYEDVSATRKTASGLTITMKNKSVIEGEEAKDKADQVIAQFKATYDVDHGLAGKEASAYRDETWAKAMAHVGVARGQWKVFENIQAAHRALGSGAIASGEHFYLLQDGKLRTLNALSREPASVDLTTDPIREGDNVQSAGGVYKARNELVAELTNRGLSKDLSDFVVREAISERSVWTDDWDVGDDTAGMLEQARRRERKRALEARETIAENLFNFTLGEDEDDITVSQIRSLEKYLDKPYYEWPKLKSLGAIKPNAEQVATLKVEIPKYLEHHHRHNKLEKHLNSKQFKDESREY